MEAPSKPSESFRVTDGHIYSLLAKCYKKQRKLIRCSSRWKETQMDEWDCGPIEWDLFTCAGSFVCPQEHRVLTAKCSAPAPGSADPAPECHEEWWALRRCLISHKMILRWNGERDCRTTA
eukprot:TRINITY_DN14088_c0_g1_i1.p2 TRINITY_DN14088_c0_g1~~TRINITY_DN14088_c0_g1_i1.p2  ORF type:complete len:121 (+),score=18.86 TRINITY_DN14088_c0_g1_i1:25-387(+)